MSLVNKMLKDLESNRHSSDRDAAKNAITGLSPPTNNVKQQSQITRIIALIIILLAIGFVGYLYLIGNRKKAEIANELKLKKVIPKMAAEQKTVAPATAQIMLQPPYVAEQNSKSEAVEKTTENMAPNKLEDYGTLSENNEFILILHFNSPIHYQLQQENNQKNLTLTLTATNLADNIPIYRPNAWVESLIFKQNADNVEMQATLQDQVELQKVTLSDEDKELQLAFVHAQTSKTMMEKSMLPLTVAEKNQEAYQQVLELLKQKKKQEAINKLQLIVKQAPGFVSARELLVILLFKNWQQQAMYYLEKGLKYNPDNSVFVTLKARILAQNGELTAAIKTLEKHSPQISAEPDYYALMASLYRKNNQYDKAVLIYARLVRLYPAQALWWVGLGVSLEALGQGNAAIGAYQRAYRLGGNLGPAIMVFLQAKVGAR